MNPGKVGGKVLVVGGAGYIGSHMTRALREQGIEPVVFDNLSTGHRWAVPDGCLVVGDLEDRQALRALFRGHDFDGVFHFASSIQVGESVSAPLKYYGNNVANTVNLLSALVEAKTKWFIFSSSAAVYGTPDSVPIPEGAELHPENPYGHTKLMVERMLADCRRAYGLRYASLRYFNAAGAHPSGEIGEAHDPESHLIPLVLQAAAGLRDAVTIFGEDYDTADGTCVRDYIHVCDLADAHLLAMRALEGGAQSLTLNLGNGEGFSVREVVELAKRVTGRPIPVRVGARRAGDPSRLVASAEQAREVLGWVPRRQSLEDIVRSAWEWMLRNRERGA